MVHSYDMIAQEVVVCLADLSARDKVKSCFRKALFHFHMLLLRDVSSLMYVHSALFIRWKHHA